MQDNIQRYEEDIIDLRELWNILVRRKGVIVMVTFLLTIVSIIYILVATPIYEVKSNVMVGYIGKEDGDRKNIAEPGVIEKRLNIVFNVEDGLKVEKFVSKVSSVTINKKLKNFITIKSEAISNEEALKKNKEVIQYLQNLYQPKIDRYVVNTENNIKATKIKIENLENLETKNIQNQIKLLKTQSIVKIDEKLAFYKNIKMKALEEKSSFHAKKLKEYTEAINNIYKTNKISKDSTLMTISSIQMVNYQNLILNSQNKIEDLKVEIGVIKNETIPNLQRDKKNMQNDTLRKIEYKLNVELPYKKVKLNEEIQQLKYNKSEQNIQNSKVIGEFVVKDSPLKPKKRLIVAIAFITGLMLSIFMVFFLEFIRVAKKEEVI